MRLAIVNLTAGGLSGGYAKYLQKLVPLLQADPRVEQVHTFTPPHHRDLPDRVCRLSPDVVFIPTARWLCCGSIPTVVMVRNMEPLTVPFGGNPLLEGARNLVRAHAARQACRRAARVIAVSRYVRDFLIGQWSVPADKIGVVYHGVDPAPDPAGMVMPPLLREIGSAPFLFTAGSIRPARGLEDVIRGTALLALTHPLRLVIAGQADRVMRGYRRRMQLLADTLGIAEQVTWVGQLHPAEMAWCYAHCAAFIMASRAEACPNTALEALSHGCRIIAAERPPMPELLVDGAWYYRAGDPRDLAEQLESVLRVSASGSEARVAAARARAQTFTWVETARKTVAELALAAASASASGLR